MRTVRTFGWLLGLAMVLAAGAPVAWAQTAATQTQASAPAAAPASSDRRLAPGFTARAAGSKLVVVPADIELFSVSAGGMKEPRADWTALAQQHFVAALNGRKPLLGPDVQDLPASALDDLAPLNTLHGAVAQSVFLHHMLGQALPTKEGRLDWTLGDAVQSLRERTGADYALFFWIHDSYASAERKAAMVALALLGVGIAGGTQLGYASLVDLRDGRVVWFNNLLRATGDLREAAPADETVEALLRGFPPVR